MFLTFLGTVSIPMDENGAKDRHSLQVYHLVWIMHFALFSTLIVNQYFSATLGIAKATLNTCVMLFQVLVLIYICVVWIFPDPEEESLQYETIPATTEAPDEAEIAIMAEINLAQKNFTFWL